MPAGRPDDLDCRQQHRCHLNAHCVYNSRTDQYRCQCLSGFRGDGLSCTRVSGKILTTRHATSQKPISFLEFQESCEVAANCSPYATCSYNQVLNIHECKCLPGFEGDGYNCIRPTCVLGVCWCPDGYQYLNEKCEKTVAATVEPGQGKTFHFSLV